MILVAKILFLTLNRILGKNELEGEIPPELANLPKLTHL